MNRRDMLLMCASGLAEPKILMAQPQYPDRSVHIVVPYAAGGGPDVFARLLGPLIGDVLGKPIVFENRVGAGGVVAAMHVEKQPADGYTLLMGSNTHLIQKALQPELLFDPLRDFNHFCSMIASPNLMVVSADSEYETLADVIKAAKANPGGMNYASGGIGTAGHLAGATFAALADVDALHIPLGGSVEILASLLRGDTAFSFPTIGTGAPQVKGGKLRALAVTSRTRVAALPDVPTLQEYFQNEAAVQESWFGLWAPSGTPKTVGDKVFTAVQEATQNSEFRNR